MGIKPTLVVHFSKPFCGLYPFGKKPLFKGAGTSVGLAWMYRLPSNSSRHEAGYFKMHSTPSTLTLPLRGPKYSTSARTVWLVSNRIHNWVLEILFMEERIKNTEREEATHNIQLTTAVPSVWANRREPGNQQKILKVQVFGISHGKLSEFHCFPSPRPRGNSRTPRDKAFRLWRVSVHQILQGLKGQPFWLFLPAIPR